MAWSVSSSVQRGRPLLSASRQRVSLLPAIAPTASQRARRSAAPARCLVPPVQPLCSVTMAARSTSRQLVDAAGRTAEHGERRGGSGGGRGRLLQQRRLPAAAAHGVALRSRRIDACGRCLLRPGAAIAALLLRQCNRMQRTAQRQQRVREGPMRYSLQRGTPGRPYPYRYCAAWCERFSVCSILSASLQDSTARRARVSQASTALHARVLASCACAALTIGCALLHCAAAVE